MSQPLFYRGLWAAVLSVCVAALVVMPQPAQRKQATGDDARLQPALNEARKVAGNLADKMRGLLLEELQKGGYEGAARICADTAQREMRDARRRTGQYVRRISLGYRNPQDAPDRYERRKLELFDQLNREKKLPDEAYEVVRERGRDYLRYMKPMVAGAACLNCHGRPEQIAPEVRAIFREQYPNDHAIGYQEGDVRGAVSVKIALPAKAKR